MFRFEDPWLLLTAILLVPVFYAYRQGRGSGKIRFSSLAPFGRIAPSLAVQLRPSLIVLRCMGIGLCVIALARPQAGQKETEVLTEGIDIMLCLDTSGSMRALDFEREGRRTDRLEVVREVVKAFIQKRQNDRIGMVVFGDQAFTQCPLTMDYGILLSFLDRIEIGMAGDSTAVGSALATGVKRLKDVPGKSKVIILLTDGRNNAGRITPETAAEIAASLKIKVYTIGVGVEGESPFEMETLFGRRYVYQKVDLDEETLKNIANITDGYYFRAKDTSGLERIYDQINKLEKTEVKVKEYMEYKELFWWFLIAALVLLLIEVVLSQTRFRKIP